MRGGRPVHDVHHGSGMSQPQTLSRSLHTDSYLRRFFCSSKDPTSCSKLCTTHKRTRQIHPLSLMKSRPFPRLRSRGGLYIKAHTVLFFTFGASAKMLRKYFNHKKKGRGRVCQVQEPRCCTATEIPPEQADTAR